MTPTASPPTASPYELAAWYPLLRGDLAVESVVRVDASTEGQTGIFDNLPEGESRLLTCGEPTFSAREASRSLVRPNPIARALRHLPKQLTAERFQVVPNTGGGFVLLPTSNRRAFRAGIDLLPGGQAKWRIAKRILRTAGHFGWRTLPGAAGVAVVSHRADRALDGSQVRHSLRGPLAAVASGVPGVNQKITVSLAETSGLPARFVKISKSDASAAQVRREVRAIEQVQRACPSLVVAPRLLDYADIAGVSRAGARSVSFLVQEALPGRRSTDVIREEHIEFLTGLCRKTLAREPLTHQRRFANDLESFVALKDDAGADWREAFGELRTAIVSFFGTTPISTHFAHGDFTPWNLRVARGHMRAFDWEYFEARAPALHDLFHFVCQTGILVQRSSAEQILHDVRELLTGPARPLFADTLLPDSHASGIFALYLFHIAVADEQLNRIERPPFEQVDWLRATRIELARRLAGELSRSRSDANHRRGARAA